MLEQIKQKVRQLKSETSVLVIAYRDKRTPLLSRLLIGLTVGYLLCPIDLIPDFIPVIGLLDDLLIVPFLIRTSIKLIPPEVIEDARKYSAENPLVLRKNNWIFAAIIIYLWILIIIYIVKIIRSSSLFA